MAKPIFTNHPFTEKSKDSPIHIKGDLIGTFIYPDIGLDHSDLNYLYLSTQKMTVVVWELSPGSQFDPPDYHPGDEIYYILNGAITELNPTTGEVCRVKKGESLLIPKYGVHIGYNFEQSVMKNFAVIAPKAVEDQLFPTDADSRKKLFKGEFNEVLPKTEEWIEGVRHGTVADLNNWPTDPDFLRKTGYLYHIPESKKLLSVFGDKTNPVLVKVCVSNDLAHVGEFVIPVGGTGPRQTDRLSHQGECLLYCVDEPVTVYIPETLETFVIKKDEALYIPPKMGYHLINYNSSPITVLFAVSAPGL